MTVSNGNNVESAAPEANVENFVQSIESVGRTSFKSDGDRIQALRSAYALISRLETPWDTVARLVMIEVFYA